MTPIKELSTNKKVVSPLTYKWLPCSFHRVKVKVRTIACYVRQRKKKQQSERAVSNTFLKRYVRLQIITQGANRSQCVGPQNGDNMANGIIHTTNFDHYSWALCSTVRDSWCSSCLHRPFAVASPPPPPSRKNLVDSSGRHRHLSILDFEHLEPKVNKIWLVKLFLSYRILIFERSHFNSLINWF